MATTFKCTLITPERQVLDEPVTYANVPAWDGAVGILHGRAPIVLELGQGVLQLDFAAGGSRWFYIAGGFAQMNDGSLSILTTECVKAEEVNKAEVEQQLRKAEGVAPGTTAEHEKKLAETLRARALLQVVESFEQRN